MIGYWPSSFYFGACQYGSRRSRGPKTGKHRTKLISSHLILTDQAWSIEDLSLVSEKFFLGEKARNPILPALVASHMCPLRKYAPTTYHSTLVPRGRVPFRKHWQHQEARRDFLRMHKDTGSPQFTDFRRTWKLSL